VTIPVAVDIPEDAQLGIPLDVPGWDDRRLTDADRAAVAEWVCRGGTIRASSMLLPADWAEGGEAALAALTELSVAVVAAARRAIGLPEMEP